MKRNITGMIYIIAFMPGIPWLVGWLCMLTFMYTMLTMVMSKQKRLTWLP